MSKERGTPQPVDVRSRCRKVFAPMLWGIALTLTVDLGGVAAEPNNPRVAGLMSVSKSLGEPNQQQGVSDPNDGVCFAAPPAEETEPIAVLLPPQPIKSAPPVVAQPIDANITPTPSTAVPTEIAARPTYSAVGGLPEQEQQLVEQVIRDCQRATTGLLTGTRLNEMALAKIRHANALAYRGAHYAARRKLIEALRMVSRLKDAQQGDRQCSSALAAGLRALDEAEDFAPRGTQLEGELELDLITAAHRTPIARKADSGETLPQQMMDRYFRYAQLKLAKSVANEPAGSMALHALGKITSQLGRLEPQRHRLAHRRAVAIQQAALLSHGENHLAAHELAVLLAESGQFAAAQELLMKVSTHQPNATVYQNLALVQQRMGLTEQAQVGHTLAAQLARQGAGKPSPVRWITPEEFVRTKGNSVPATAQPNTGKQPMTRRPRHDQRTAWAPVATEHAPQRPATSVESSTANWR